MWGAIRDRDASSDGFRCRPDGLPTVIDASRWCHRIDAHHPTVRGSQIRGARRPRDRDAHFRSARRVGLVGDFRSCRLGARRTTCHELVRERAHSEPDDQEPDGAPYPSTNPRCRHRRHRTIRQIPTAPERSVRRRDGDADATPRVTRGRDEATRRWPVRSSAAADRCHQNSAAHRTIRWLARRRRIGVHRNRRREHRRARRVPRRRYGATCRRSSVPPALRRRAVPALSCSRPGRSSRRGRG